jgi:hypothetical protein
LRLATFDGIAERKPYCLTFGIDPSGGFELNPVFRGRTGCQKLKRPQPLASEVCDEAVKERRVIELHRIS